MQNRIGELAAIISESVARVNEVLSSHGSDLSFDDDAPLQVRQDSNFAEGKDTALEACEELQYLLAGPTRSLMTQRVSDTMNLQAICHFGIATKFPENKDGTTYKELSEISGLREPDVRRILRGAMTNHVFKEEPLGVVKHTAASNMLAKNPLMRQWIGMYAEDLLPAGLKAVNAMVTWPDSQEPNHAGYSIANNTEKICWEFMETTSDRAKRFGDAMSLFSYSPAYSPGPLIHYMNDENLTKGVLVDVGGSQGAFSMPIANRFPDIKCIIQDRPEVIARVHTHVRTDELAKLDGPVEFMSHDFFTSQLIHGADIYLLRWILHGWSDKYAIKILRSLIPALKNSSRVLIHECIVPEPGQDTYLRQQNMRIFDFHMRALCNGKEREVNDWHNLLREADPRFRIRQAKPLPGSDLGIIDVEWKEEEKID